MDAQALCYIPNKYNTVITWIVGGQYKKKMKEVQRKRISTNGMSLKFWVSKELRKNLETVFIEVDKVWNNSDELSHFTL